VVSDRPVPTVEVRVMSIGPPTAGKANCVGVVPLGKRDVVKPVVSA